uniref:Putative ovule protein n=1 Tax=Solanum chacoense TaxID=4108 RepID=A0A0V0H9B8_SOLCH
MVLNLNIFIRRVMLITSNFFFQKTIFNSFCFCWNTNIPVATPSITCIRSFLYNYISIIRQLDKHENFRNNLSTCMR